MEGYDQGIFPSNNTLINRIEQEGSMNNTGEQNWRMQSNNNETEQNKNAVVSNELAHITNYMSEHFHITTQPGTHEHQRAGYAPQPHPSYFHPRAHSYPPPQIHPNPHLFPLPGPSCSVSSPNIVPAANSLPLKNSFAPRPRANVPVVINKTQRRERTTFTKQQLETFQSVYETTVYPDVITRANLAARLNLPEFRIQIWFKNHRAKDRQRQRQKLKQQHAENFRNKVRQALVKRKQLPSQQQLFQQQPFGQLQQPQKSAATFTMTRNIPNALLNCSNQAMPMISLSNNKANDPFSWGFPNSMQPAGHSHLSPPPCHQVLTNQFDQQKFDKILDGLLTDPDDINRILNNDIYVPHQNQHDPEKYC